jgi:hypothetical protein
MPIKQKGRTRPDLRAPTPLPKCPHTRKEKIGNNDDGITAVLGRSAMDARAWVSFLTAQDRIMIKGTKSDGTYLVEFTTAAGEGLVISIPGREVGR